MRRARVGVVLLALVASALSAQTVTVTKPAAGETVARGKTYAIAWTKSGTMDPNVRISLRNPTTLDEVALIADPAPNSGTCAWDVPSNLAEGSYRIRVKVKNQPTFDDSDVFKIGGTAPLQARPLASSALRPPEILAHRNARLSVSGYDVGCNPDGFVVTFAYKNSGTDPLPKGSTLPVKPDFRVLVGGKQVNQGSLFIPEFEAPPGWEVPFYHACEIKFQPPGEFDRYWVAGASIDFHINENKVIGPNPDIKTWSLRNMTLIRCGFDAQVVQAIYDPGSENLTTSVLLDGHFEGFQKFRLFYSGTSTLTIDPNQGGFSAEYSVDPNKVQYEIKHKLHPPSGASAVRGWVGVYLLKPNTTTPDNRDINHPNNFYYLSVYLR